MVSKKTVDEIVKILTEEVSQDKAIRSAERLRNETTGNKSAQILKFFL